MSTVNAKNFVSHPERGCHRYTWLALCVFGVATATDVYALRGQDTVNDKALSFLPHLAAANSALRLNEAADARRWLDEIPAPARAWEWQLLHARVDSSIQRLHVDPWTPVRLDLSASGKLLAVAGTDGLVRIYDAHSMDLIHEWRVSEQAVYAARIHPQEHHIAVCSRDGQLSVWEIATQQQLWKQKSGGQGLADLAYRPDGQQLLFCSWYRGPQTVLGSVSTWDTTGQKTWSTEFGVKPIVTARYSPDGKYFAVGTWDALVGMWQSDSPGEPKVFDFADRPQYSAIDDIAFSPDSKQIAAATKNGTPRIWSLEDSKPFVDMIGHSSAVFSIAFTKDGKSLLTGGSDGVLAVWDISQRVQKHRFHGHTNRIVSILAAPGLDRVITAAADNSLRVWDMNSAQGFESSEAGKYAYGLVVANGGKTLVTGGQSDTTISVWDASTKASLRHFPGTPSTINYLDGDGENWIAGGNWSGDVCIWDISTGAIVREMGSKELGGMQQCSLSDDRKWVASATNKKQVVIWNAQTGDVVKIIPIENGCWGIDFSSDGKSLAVGDGKGIVHWISTDDWNLRWSCQAGSNQINTVRISKAGDWLAVGTESGLLAIVDVKVQQVKHRTQGHSERIWTLDISPDGHRIATGSADRKIKTWDPHTGVSLLTIADFSEPLYNLRFSTDGRSLYVNSLGARIQKLSLDH